MRLCLHHKRVLGAIFARVRLSLARGVALVTQVIALLAVATVVALITILRGQGCVTIILFIKTCTEL